MFLSSRIIRLKLKHTWTISRASVDDHENIFVDLEHEGITGVGEASFSRRYGETPESLQEFIEAAKPLLAKANPLHFVEIAEQVHNLHAGQSSAKAAIDMALLDWIGKKNGRAPVQMVGTQSGANADFFIHHRHRHAGDDATQNSRSRRVSHFEN